MNTFVRIKWSYRLLRSKHFVLLTDKAACISLEGAKPESFSDVQSLLSQQSELSLFQSSLGRLIRSHRETVSKLRSAKMKGVHAKTHTQKRGTSRTTTVRKTTKAAPKAK